MLICKMKNNRLLFLAVLFYFLIPAPFVSAQEFNLKWYYKIISSKGFALDNKETLNQGENPILRKNGAYVRLQSMGNHEDTRWLEKIIIIAKKIH